MRQSSLLLALFTLLASACGLFPSLTDLSGGNVANCTGEHCTDAATPGTDAAKVDLDASSLPDANAPDAPTTAFCASQGSKSLLCDDFDTAPLPDAFAGSDVGKGGRIGLDLEDGGTGSRFLYSAIAAGSPTDATAYLGKNFPNAATKFSLAFSVRVVTRTAGQGADIARIILVGDAAGGGLHHLLVNYRGYLELGEQFGPGLSTYVGHTPSASPNMGEWARVVINMNVATHELEVLLNGASVLKEGIDPSWAPAAHRLTFGISFAQGAADGWRYDLDDVLYDAK